MEMQGETTINAGRPAVFAALCDPAVLARCIDGVESLDAIGPNRFAGVLNARVGPVRAKFTGEVALTEIDAPSRYVLVGEGKGGVAGFAKGSAEVTLADAADGGTILRYTAKSTVGGKLAQLGSRLIEGAAKGYAEAFFAAFKTIVETPAAPALSSDPAPSPDTTAHTVDPAIATDMHGRSLSPLMWGALLVVGVIVLLIAMLRG
jgi:uncharacterized protein